MARMYFVRARDCGPAAPERRKCLPAKEKRRARALWHA